MWQAIGAAAGGILNKGIDFGLGVAGGQISAGLTRDLRRNQYQDMVHSLKQAGLNPLLAVGGTPGGPAMSIGTGGPSNILGDWGTALDAARNPSQIALNEAQTGKIGEEEKLVAAQRLQTFLNMENLKLEQARLRSDTALNAAKAVSEMARAGLYKGQAGKITHEIGLLTNQSAQSAAQAQLALGELDYLRKYGKPGLFSAGNWINSSGTALDWANDRKKEVSTFYNNTIQPGVNSAFDAVRGYYENWRDRKDAGGATGEW